MKRFILGISVCLAAAPALASGNCEIEAWRYTYMSMGGLLTIEGSASCESGLANIRLFGGPEGKEFLGVASGIVEGHALTAIAHGIHEKPETLTIKYSISEGF